jgi:hypothetical protein
MRASEEESVSVGADLLADRPHEPTAEHVWHSLAGRPITDELLEWPADVLALTNVILTRTGAFRFTLAPASDWPPGRYGDWAREVEQAGRRWSAWADKRRGTIPGLVLAAWKILRERVDVPLEQVATGQQPELCEALLTLHAVADEACAGLGIALDSSDGDACAYRGRGRELLARTGSLARVNPRFMLVLPKVVTPPTGTATFSRYACVHGPGIAARWHKVPARHRGTDITSEFANLLLLPWPMRVRESDFRAVAGSVQRLAKEPFGFFEFAPAEALDLDLLDRVLVAAREEVNSVDVVLLPESAVSEDEIGPLERLLDRHGVNFVYTGVRQRCSQVGRLPGNWLHTGISPRFEKGADPPPEPSGPWFPIRQNKHHRWALDHSQILQYHLGGVLHPDIQWWEAIDVPRLAVEFVEVAELTMVTLVCQDLASDDDMAALIRSVGPTLVLTVLLDGPQLTSRWSARYASVLADDPGSAVLTLTSFGMVQRSRPHGRDASSTIALWKDPSRGVREIPLEAGAQGVVLTVCMNRAARRSADGRWPVDNGTLVYDAGVHQIRPATVGSGASDTLPTPSARPAPLEIEEITILTGWAEAMAEVLAYAPQDADAILAEARSGAAWRSGFGLPQPSPQLGRAISAMGRAVLTAAPNGAVPTFDSVLRAASEDHSGDSQLDALVWQALRAMLEERRTRNPLAGAG